MCSYRTSATKLALALAVILFIPLLVQAAADLPNGLLTIGSRGPEVQTLQKALNVLGYDLVEDGIYGPGTRWAVLDFQRRHDALGNDGIYGPRTRSFMMDFLKPTGDELPKDYVLEDLEEDLALTFLADRQGRAGLVAQAFVEENRHLLRVSEDQYAVEQELATQLPELLKTDWAYNEYPMAYDYVLVTSNTLNVRQEPTTRSPIVSRLSYFDKVNVIQVVKGEYLDTYGSDHWYRVFWHTGEGVNMGFVFGALGELRSFRLPVMFEEVKTLQQVIARSRMGYVFNYRHIHGMAPAHRDRNEDAHGVSRNQSAPGYTDLDLSDFRYFSDGMLVALLDETEAFYLVSTSSFPGEYWIPRRYISFTHVPSALTQVVVIDDIYQNEAVFQLVDQQWELISYTFATTGIQKGSYHFETPKGHFMAIEKRPFFWYVQDGTHNTTGFAPYSIRFSGGGFIHGVPVELGEGQTPYNTSPTNPDNHREYLFTIGTTPRSHKCVRNFTSHAKFLYDWLQIGEAAFIIIE